jgi:hypothetical protein
MSTFDIAEQALKNEIYFIKDRLELSKIVLQAMQDLNSKGRKRILPKHLEPLQDEIESTEFCSISRVSVSFGNIAPHSERKGLRFNSYSDRDGWSTLRCWIDDSTDDVISFNDCIEATKKADLGRRDELEALQHELLNLNQKLEMIRELDEQVTDLKNNTSYTLMSALRHEFRIFNRTY